jgi:hypothetical protein
MTRLPVLVNATVTNKDSSGAQHIEYHSLSAALALVVQLLTAATALAPLVLVLLFNAVIFTPLILPSLTGTNAFV